MSIRQRIVKLEIKATPPDADEDVRIHWYEKNAGDEDRPYREECPTCAAMTDEDYAEYEARLRKHPKRISHIIIVRPAEAGEELNHGTENPS